MLAMVLLVINVDVKDASVWSSSISGSLSYIDILLPVPVSTTLPVTFEKLDFERSTLCIHPSTQIQQQQKCLLYSVQVARRQQVRHPSPQ
jgi:hypothetical protein